MNLINIDTKFRIIALARQRLTAELDEAKKQLADLSSSSAEEDKSSAGDKYETQREMIRQSQDILDRQLARIQEMINQLEKIPIRTCSKVQEGALVKLAIGLVWVGVHWEKYWTRKKNICLYPKIPRYFLLVTA